MQFFSWYYIQSIQKKIIFKGTTKMNIKNISSREKVSFFIKFLYNFLQFILAVFSSATYSTCTMRG